MLQRSVTNPITITSTPTTYASASHSGALGIIADEGVMEVAATSVVIRSWPETGRTVELSVAATAVTVAGGATVRVMTGQAGVISESGGNASAPTMPIVRTRCRIAA